ncbi:MAG: response regulator, partial [Deltaproteobacteria bacterium]|nr:response regulator [Deltaproteobacteria bacterium]
MGASILVADDEVGVRDLLKWELGGSGYDVTVVANGHEAVEALRRAEFDLVISDVRMPGITGLEVLKATKELAPDTEVLIATGYADLETAVACVRGGAFDFVQKPLDMNGLLATVARALERRRLRAATALYQASQTIFATKEAFRLPEAIVAVAMKVMAADDVSVMVPEAGNQLRLLHSHGLAPELQAEVRAAIGERVAGRVAQSREPALLPDGLGQDARFADVPTFGRVRSSIVYPLFAGDRLLGVLNISRLQNPKPFRKEDLERASVLAAQVTLALENVRLIQ